MEWGTERKAKMEEETTTEGKKKGSWLKNGRTMDQE